MCELIGAHSLNILAQKHSMEKTLGFTEMMVFKQNSKQKTKNKKHAKYYLKMH